MLNVSCYHMHNRISHINLIHFSFCFFFSFFLFPNILCHKPKPVGIVGPSLASYSEPSNQPISSSLADTTYPKQNQYFDSTNMAYVLELSNHKTNQNNDDDDEYYNRSNNDNNNNNSHNDNDNFRKISNQKSYNNFNNNSDYGNVSSRDNTNNLNNALNRGPFFDVSASKNVTALVGKIANLNCRIKNLGNKTV